MKKRLLLIIIAGVCLSPSVFADYVGNATTTFHKDTITGEVVSEKGSAQSVGSFNKMPPPTISASPDVAGAADCPIWARNEVKRLDYIDKTAAKVEEHEANIPARSTADNPNSG